ncbi:MAG: helix-turn-helix domain-containing protein [Chloroflexota bacterium]|nr:helix-turn-helix domain-containing protein [Chloroflexota bacterium]MDE2942359.1 helix-turn-helix domain-containing protein [Chloroflexota bacterium]MDE3268080.1 helix-turn-helix domain-containing protein [Chloroflexota bacterium]
MTATNTANTTRAETELRAAARRRGLTMKELAEKMGTTPSYLSQIATGNRPWSPGMREKAEAVLGEVPGQGIVYRQGGVVQGESSYIRERARELGMSMQELAERAKVSYGYMVQVSRGHRNMGVKVQKRVESALEAPAKVAPARCADVDRQAVWERMDAHGISQNEVARRAGVSSGHLSQIMNGSRTPSPGVLKRLHGVLFRRTAAERVMPVELKVLGWKKGERSGMVVKGAGGPGRGEGGGAIRTGGRVPWGAKVEYAFRTGYDGLGRVSVEHVVDRGCSAMLKRAEAAA